MIAILGRTAYDIKSILERDPAARNAFEVWLTYSGVHALSWHRVAYFLHVKAKLKLLARIVSQTCRFFTGIEIHPAAKIEGGVFIDHGMGVVIGETAEVHRGVVIYQGATLGGTGKDAGKRHPTLGDNVMVGAGAKVLGPFTIADNAKIAANAVVLKEIPENSTAVGMPAKVVRREGMRVESDLDQIHIPDPVAQEIKRLEDRIAELEKQLGEKK